jgi:hypothetical protein
VTLTTHPHLLPRLKKEYNCTSFIELKKCGPGTARCDTNPLKAQFKNKSDAIVYTLFILEVSDTVHLFSMDERKTNLMQLLYIFIVAVRRCSTCFGRVRPSSGALEN